MSKQSELDEIFQVYIEPHIPQTTDEAVLSAIHEAKQALLALMNEARIDEIKRTRPHLTYPGMVYYGERMNELRGAETEEVK